MKIQLTILFVFSFLANAFSQEGLSIHLKGIEGCYLDYYSAFANRGAKPVTDGDHEVVISIIFQNKSDCYLGKASMKDGKFVLPVLIQKEDMSFAPLSTIFKNLDQDWLDEQDEQTLYEINGGMSMMFKSQQGYQVQMFFPSFINSGSGANRKAPPANQLLKQGN